MVANPNDPIPTIQPQPAQTMSPAAIQQLRAYAKALQEQKNTTPFYTWGNGLNDLTKALTSGWADRTANEQEARTQAAYWNNKANYQTGQGTPNPATVPGGTGAGSPFSQASSGTSSAADTLGPPPQADPTQATPTAPDLVSFVKNREGFSPTPYPDGKQTSIGYGTEASGPDDRVDRPEAERRLKVKLQPAMAFVQKIAPDAPPAIKTALADLTFNTGTNWANAGLGQAVRSGDYATAGQLFQQYNKVLPSGQELRGLTARRQALAPAFATGGAAAPTPAGTPAAPTRVAQARLPPGNMQSDLAELYRGMAQANQPPSEMENIGKAIEYRAKTQPQYGLGTYGQITREAPGEIPSIIGQQPGALGQVEDVKDIPGVKTQTTYGPGGLRTRFIIPDKPPEVVGGKPATAAPTAAPAPAATPSPVPAKTVPAGTTAAPAAPAPAGTPAPVKPPGSMLSSPPPGFTPPSGTKPGSQLAMADMAKVNPFERVYDAYKGKPPEKVAGADDVEKSPDYNLDTPTTTEEIAAKGAIDTAIANPVASPSLPEDIREKAFQKGTIDALGNIKPNIEAHTRALEDKVKLQDKGYAELQKQFRDSLAQSVKLSPELKLARGILNNPNFQAGPANQLITLGRGLREELGRLADDSVKDAEHRGESSDWAKKLRNWALDPANRDATANQVYTKILSGSILQSLRGMLGPNAGQFRQMELAMLRQAFGNPDMTLDANKVVMSMIDRINDRSMLIGKMAAQYSKRKPGGGLDSSFEDALSDFERQNPAFSPKEFDTLLRVTATGRTGTEKAPAVVPAPGAPSPRNDALREEMRKRGFIK